MVEQGKSYIVMTEVEKINRNTDMKKATIKAKSQLARYLNPKSKSVSIEIKQFQFISKSHYSDKIIYRFKIDKDNVQVIY